MRGHLQRASGERAELFTPPVLQKQAAGHCYLKLTFVLGQDVFLVIHFQSKNCVCVFGPASSGCKHRSISTKPPVGHTGSGKANGGKEKSGLIYPTLPVSVMIISHDDCPSVRSLVRTHLKCCVQLLAPHFKKDIGGQQRLQRISHEEQLRELGLFSLQEGNP